MSPEEEEQGQNVKTIEQKKAEVWHSLEWLVIAVVTYLVVGWLLSL